MTDPVKPPVPPVPPHTVAPATKSAPLTPNTSVKDGPIDTKLTEESNTPRTELKNPFPPTHVGSTPHVPTPVKTDSTAHQTGKSTDKVPATAKELIHATAQDDTIVHEVTGHQFVPKNRTEQLARIKMLLKNSGMDTQQQEKFVMQLDDIL